MVKRQFCRTVSKGVLVLLLTFIGTPGFSQGYVLQQGDVLELSIVSVPDLHETMPIDIEGNVIVPIIGTVRAAGRSLVEVSSEVATLISGSGVPVNSSGMISDFRQVHPSMISLRIKEYRAVYIDGEVRNPGAHDFTPGLTARQAIALAGGGGSGTTRDSLTLQMITLDGTIRQLEVEIAALDERIARLQVESGRQDRRTISGEASLLSRLEWRAEQFANDLLAGDLAYYDQAITSVTTQIESLQQQAITEGEGAKGDADEYHKLTEALANGAVTAARVSEVRRAMQFSRSQRFDTEARLAGAQREYEDLINRRAQRAATAQREASIELANEIARRDLLAAELAGAQDQRAYYAAILESGGNILFSIQITNTDGTRVQLGPNEDRTLFPGDMLLISAEMPESKSLPDG